MKTSCIIALISMFFMLSPASILSSSSEPLIKPRSVTTIPWGIDNRPKNNTEKSTVEIIDPPNNNFIESRWRSSVSVTIYKELKDDIDIIKTLSDYNNTIIVHIFIENDGRTSFREIYTSERNDALRNSIINKFKDFIFLSPPPSKADGNLHLKITLPAKHTLIGSRFKTTLNSQKISNNTADLTTPPTPAPEPRVPVVEKPSPRPSPRPDYPSESQLDGNEVVTVSIATDRTVYVNEEKVARDDILNNLDRVTGGNKEQRIYVRADKLTSYEVVVQILSLITNQGYKNIGLVTLEQSP